MTTATDFNPQISLNTPGYNGMPAAIVGYADVIEAMIGVSAAMQSGGAKHTQRLLVEELRNPATPAERQSEINGALLDSYMTSGVFDIPPELDPAPGRTYTKTTGRGEEACAQHCGVLAYDLDRYESTAAAQQDISRLSASPNCYYALLSKRGRGAHIGIRIASERDLTLPAEHKAVWNAVCDFLESEFGIAPQRQDTSSQNVNRIHFVSWDPDGYLNRGVEALDADALIAAAAERQPPQDEADGDIDLSLVDISYLPTYVHADDASKYEGLVASLLKLGRHFAVAYRDKCDAANSECTRTGLDRLDRLGHPRERGVAFAQVLALQKKQGWTHPKARGRGRPSNASRAAEFLLQAQARGIANADYLTPMRSAGFERIRIEHYGATRLLNVPGLGTNIVQICDDFGYWHAVSYSDELTRQMLTSVCDAFAQRAADELSALGDDFGREQSDALLRQRLSHNALINIVQDITNHGLAYPQCEADLFGRRRPGYMQTASGMLDLEREALMTDMPAIKRMRQRADATPTPAPDFELLDADRADLPYGARIAQDAIAQQWGRGLMRRLALGLISAGKFTLVAQALPDVGKTTLISLMRAAFGLTGEVDMMDAEARRGRFSRIGLSLSKNMYTFLDEAHKAAGFEQFVFDATAGNANYEPKGEMRRELPRFGIGVAFGNTPERKDDEHFTADFGRPGFIERVQEVTQFYGASPMPSEMRSALTMPGQAQSDAAAYLRAYLCREAGAIIREFKAAEGVDYIDITECERRTRTQQGVEVFDRIVGETNPHLRALRDTYEYQPGEWTPHSELAEVLYKHGIPATTQARVITAHIRRALFDGRPVKSVLQTINGVRAYYWEVGLRRAQGAPTDAAQIAPPTDDADYARWSAELGVLDSDDRVEH